VRAEVIMVSSMIASGAPRSGLKRYEPEFARQSEAMVVDEISDYLGPADVLGSQMAPQDIEVPRAPVGRHQMNSWLEHNLALSLSPDGALDGHQDLGPRQVEALDVMSGDKS
jgi:hypothetical protein